MKNNFSTLGTIGCWGTVLLVAGSLGGPTASGESSGSGVICFSANGGTACSLAPTGSGNPPDDRYQRLSPQETWSNQTCYIEVPDFLEREQQRCLRLPQEFACRSRSGVCEWQQGKQECWSADYARCPRVMRSLCTEIKIVKRFPTESESRRRYHCDPTRSGRMVRLAPRED